ncbi:MAG: arginine--tRNA ligase [Pseudomonadota bacterium]
MRQKVIDLFTEALETLRSRGVLQVESLPRFTVDAPKNPEHGDFAVNAALVLAKPARQKPRDLAQAIIDALDDSGGIVEGTEIAGPGFINVRLSSRLWQGVIGDIEAAGARFGCGEPGSRGHINVEYVSANPTGPLHVGHGRGAVVGDALTRLLAAAGYQVTREYYINDHGNQVDTLARSLHLRYQELHGRSVEFPTDAYPAEYVRDIARTLVDAHGDRFLDAEPDAWMDLFRQQGMQANLDSIQADLQALGVVFDVWTRESSLHASGEVRGVVEVLAAQGNSYLAERSEAVGDKVRREESKAAKHAGAQQGGTFARLSAFGDSDDRIVLRSDGRPVYLTADLAYHRAKLHRGYDLCIDVFGADHFSHTNTLKAGLAAMGEDPARLEFVLTQIVRLIRGGEEVRISKRAGNIELLSDLMAAAGHDATRFFFLMRAPGAQFDFDLDVAASRGLDNPVFYVQYGHARVCAVFRRATDSGVKYKGYDADTAACLTLPEELGLLRKMAAYGDIIASSAESREPHRVVYYIEDLIRDFHAYYTRYKRTERILSDDTQKTQARLGLVNALRQVLRNALEVLGVAAPEQMDAVVQDEDQEVTG